MAGCRIVSAAAEIEPAGSVTVRGSTLRYWRLDRGVPETVLCLHGLGGDHRGLAELADALPDVNVVLPDLPGYGLSGPMSDVHSLVNYADAIADLRHALGLGTCHLLGHSLGASIALVHAARHGAGLLGLCLLNPVSTASNATATLGKLYYRIAAALPGPVARFWLASRPAVYVADSFVITTKDQTRRRLILEQDYENYRRASVPAMVQSFLSYYDTPFTDHAARITAPALLVTGDRDSIAPVRSVTMLADRIPTGSLALVPGAGHLVPMEEPADIAALVYDFIVRIRSTVDGREPAGLGQLVGDTR
jgi:pimeloyl-ACP methyl ester carboxylesterase